MRRRGVILSRDDIPGLDPSSVFNPGAIRMGDRTVLLLRVQTRGRETRLMVADSGDGVAFDVHAGFVEIDGLDTTGLHHIYDPRLTRIDDTVYVVYAADTDEGCRLGIARTTDMECFEHVSLGPPDVRNGVLFPEQVGGRYVRLERPNNRDGSGDAIALAASDDLVAWETVGEVMRGRWRYWDEYIGSGPPPLRVDDGWLHVYHGIATHFGGGLYQAGVVLLDADDPTRVLARSRENVLEPRELYEQVGQVPNVVFPSGWVVDGQDIRIYYGAADTCVALAETTIPELLDACT